MDLRIIVEVFVVVVIRGLGSVTGAFVAALIVSELNAFGILILPTISLVLVFAIMAVVLVLRPRGLFGKAVAPRPPQVDVIKPWTPLGPCGRLAATGLPTLAAGLPLILGEYGLSVAAEILIFVIFAVSLHLIMSGGGLASFGHAAFFGLGAYGAALGVKYLALPMGLALLAGPVLIAIGPAIAGLFVASLSGVYFAMLTLAFAQIVWSIAFQWVSVTGGDNDILGTWPAGFAASSAGFYWLVLALAVVLGMRAVILSPFSHALRAVRYSALRADAIWLISKTDYSKLVLGLVIEASVVIFPKGLVGTALDLRLPVLRREPPDTPAPLREAEE